MKKKKLITFLNIEQQQLNDMLKQQFGYYLLLIGHDNLELVHDCQINKHILLIEQHNETPSIPLTNPKNTVQSSWYHLPFPPQSLDLIVLHHVLEFSAAPHSILKEVQTVLRPDGHVIISAFNPWRPYGHTLWKKMKKKHTDKRHAHMLSLIEIKYFLQQTSFEVLDTKHYGSIGSRTNYLHEDKRLNRLLLKLMPFLSGAFMISAINRTKMLTGLPNGWQPYTMSAKKQIAATPCRQPKLKVIENVEP